MSTERPKNDLVMADLGQIDPRELAPDDPVRWRDWPGSERPYQTIEEEYVRSPRPLSLKVLRERWQGLYEERSLREMRETIEWRVARTRYQDELAKNALNFSIAGDVEWQKRRIDLEIVSIVHHIEQVDAELNAGYEYAPSKAAGPLGYVRRPLSVDSRRKLLAARVELSNTLATRLGLANQIVQVNVREESLEERLKRFMVEHDEEFSQLHQRVTQALPAGVLRGDEGDSLRSQMQADREAGRVIDVTPLPAVNQ